MQASAESIYEGLTTLLGVPYDRDKMTLHVNQRASFVPPIFPCIVALFGAVNRIGFDRWTPTTTTGLTFHPSFCRTVYVGPASLNALEGVPIPKMDRLP